MKNRNETFFINIYSSPKAISIPDFIFPKLQFVVIAEVRNCSIISTITITFWIIDIFDVIFVYQRVYIREMFSFNIILSFLFFIFLFSGKYNLSCCDLAGKILSVFSCQQKHFHQIRLDDLHLSYLHSYHLLPFFRTAKVIYSGLQRSFFKEENLGNFGGQPGI